MSLYLTKHPQGPELPEAAKGRKFRSYVALADFADKIELPEGKYWCRNTNGTNLWTAMREVTRKGSGFHVEGRGNV